jgi:uncharacterized protein
MSDPEISVQDNAAEHRYDIFFDGALAGFAAYRDEDGCRVFTHTKIDPDFEGHGLGGRLARGALDDVRGRGIEVVAQCPFIAGYIARHAEYADLVRG